MKFYEAEYTKEFEALENDILLNRICGNVVLDLKKVSVEGIPDNLMQIGDIINSYVKYLGYDELVYDTKWFEQRKGFFKKIITGYDEESLLLYNKKVDELYYTMNNCIVWKGINYNTAKQVASYILRYDLAYKLPVIEENMAETFVNTFFNFFSNKAIYFTNASFSSQNTTLKIEGWNPITDATFDIGVVAFDGSKIGIFLVMDED